MPQSIDKTAFIADGARLAPDVEIGPYCRVGPNATLGDGVKLLSHVVVDGHTHIGPGTEVHPFTVLGGPPQHLRYQGEPTRLSIGSECVIREQVSIHRATAHGGGETIIGDRVYVMSQVHIAHDCKIGNDVVFAGNCTLGGHVEIGHNAIIGGVSAIHQFCRIGERAMVGGGAAVPMDVIPYGSAIGNHARLAGLNIVGMKRAGLSRDAIGTLRAAFEDLFGPGDVPFRARIDPVAARYPDSEEVTKMLDFLRTDANRPILPLRVKS
ncbi:MAG: acyl-ACP--UDP-N-acetylglucosamine O-acyltransferase [Pseudomonadota bacterium]